MTKSNHQVLNITKQKKNLSLQKLTDLSVVYRCFKILSLAIFFSRVVTQFARPIYTLGQTQLKPIVGCAKAALTQPTFEWISSRPYDFTQLISFTYILCLLYVNLGFVVIYLNIRCVITDCVS